MSDKGLKKATFSVLDTAIVVGLAALFLSAAVPLVRGAILRQRAAECARKIIQAADAFDLYAAAFGAYPQSQPDAVSMERMMRGVFAASDLEWWTNPTELGGRWSWHNGDDGVCIVISGDRLSERLMGMLDSLLDDGDLETGLFQRAPSCYRYTLAGLVQQARFAGGEK